MPGQLIANVGLMKGSSDQLASQADGIGAILDNLDCQVRTLLSRWGGDAQEAYQHAQADWGRSLAAMRDLLAEAGRLTGKAAGRYDAADAFALRRFGG